MNEKGVGATGKESLWEAVRRGLAGSTLKLASPLPIGNQHIYPRMAQGLRADPRVCSWGFRRKAQRQRHREFWGEAAPTPFLALSPPKWVGPQLLICGTGTTLSPSQGCRDRMGHTGPCLA